MVYFTVRSIYKTTLKWLTALIKYLPTHSLIMGADILATELNIK